MGVILNCSIIDNRKKRTDKLFFRKLDVILCTLLLFNKVLKDLDARFSFLVWWYQTSFVYMEIFVFTTMIMSPYISGVSRSCTIHVYSHRDLVTGIYVNTWGIWCPYVPKMPLREKNRSTHQIYGNNFTYLGVAELCSGRRKSLLVVYVGIQRGTLWHMQNASIER